MTIEQIRFKGIAYLTGLEIECLDQKILSAMDSFQILIHQIKKDQEVKSEEILLQCNSKGIFNFKNNANDGFPNHKARITGINYSPKDSDLIYTLKWQEFQTLNKSHLLKVDDLIWYDLP
ncbi:MAG: hypothetical protein KJ674_00330 [Nanoarchaeota archaeon]|nr:hypothetical protein [Nanoarchaeota archaeon]